MQSCRRLAHARRASSLAWRTSCRVGTASKKPFFNVSKQKTLKRANGSKEKRRKGDVGIVRETNLQKQPLLLSRPQNLMPGAPEHLAPLSDLSPVDTAYGRQALGLFGRWDRLADP
ncbi:hypothetical protein PVAP13_2NG070646 [Panicum virgatum]|uniref:Uncharacterized protein n=1 Tax=Panicum virgatum TaxID=38727 RepID=A0A8T0VHS0_PANVG|nr:hypothetical protein PVAP13_2NG070646 [Panicum virgatum]